MAKSRKTSASLKKLEQREQKQERKLKQYESNQRWMKWLAIGILILILLLLLGAGYATDWTRGLNKDASVNTPATATGTELDASGQPISGAGGAGGTGGPGGTNGGGGSTSTTTNSSTTTTTNTTNNPPGGGNGSSTLIDELIKLYNDTGLGGNVNDLINRATSLGIEVNCTNGLLTSDCTFSVGDASFTVRSLLGTGLISGILDVVDL